MMKNNTLTEGQRLVGLTFNDKIIKYKLACANAIDILLELEDKTKKELDIFLDRNKRTRAIFNKRVQMAPKITAESFIDNFINVILAGDDNKYLSEAIELFLFNNYLAFFMNINHQYFYLVIKYVKDCRYNLSRYNEDEGTGLTLFLGSLNEMAVFIGCEETINGRLFDRVI